MFFNSVILKSLAILFLLLGAAEVNASITYTSSSFRNFRVDTDTDMQLTASADIFQGNVLAGTATVTMVYVAPGTTGGTSPFVRPENSTGGLFWSASDDFRITASSPADLDENNETAFGAYTISVTANAGFQVDGISLFTDGTVLANPTFQDLSSNGVGSIADLSQGAANELLANYDDGDSFVNGDDLIFNDGDVTNGFSREFHSRLWSFDSAGATLLTFDYLVGPVRTITNEGIRFDVQLSTVPVPEPGNAVLLGIASLFALRRRKHA